VSLNWLKPKDKNQIYRIPILRENS